MPHLTAQTLGIFFALDENRSAEQKQIAALSESLAQELFDANVIVIGAPIYNFSITSGLKAWVDHVARARMIFKDGENGPVGWLAVKKALFLPPAAVSIAKDLQR